MKNKRLFIIIGVLGTLYLVYLFFIRKWMEENGYSTRITTTPNTPKRPFASIIRGLGQIQFVEGVERS